MSGAVFPLLHIQSFRGQTQLCFALGFTFLFRFLDVTHVQNDADIIGLPDFFVSGFLSGGSSSYPTERV